MYVLVCKGLTIDDVGVSVDTVAQETRPGAGLETGDFVKENLGGATVERLSRGVAFGACFCSCSEITSASDPPCFFVV